MSEEWSQKRVQKAFKELGFELPTTEKQLNEFNEKFKNYPYKLTGKEIDPIDILEMTDTTQQSAEEQAKVVYSRMTSFANYDQMNGIEKSWFLKCIKEGLESFAKQEVKESTKAILDDIEFGYDLDMIKSKLKHGDYE